ncbi:MAG: LPS assembly lipoprotein LptE [Verrucomicrobiota bacterium]
MTRLRIPPSSGPRSPLSGILLLSAVLCALSLAGCAGYQLGTGATPRFATLFVAPVKTAALVPQARAELTTRIREAFIRDGRVRLVNSAETADAVLHLTIAGYNRTVAVARADDTGLARRFDITLQARATLLDNRTRGVLFTDRLLESKRGAFTDDGLVPAEDQLLPILGESLATEAVHAVLDTW